MSTYNDLVDQYGRPEPVPPRVALAALDAQAEREGRPKDYSADPDTVQAQKFYSREMAEAFTGGAQGTGRFLGLAEDPAEPGTFIGAWTVSASGAASLAERNRVV